MPIQSVPQSSDSFALQFSDSFALQFIAKADKALNFETNTYLGKAAEATAQTLSYPVLSVANLVAAVVLGTLAVITATTIGAVSTRAQEGIVKPLFREATGAAEAASRALTNTFTKREEPEQIKDTPKPAITQPKTWKELANQKIEWVQGKCGEAMASERAQKAVGFCKDHKRELQGAAAVLVLGTTYYAVTSYMGWAPISNLQDQIRNLWKGEDVQPPLDRDFCPADNLDTCPADNLDTCPADNLDTCPADNLDTCQADEPSKVTKLPFSEDFKKRNNPLTYIQSGFGGFVGYGANAFTGNRFGPKKSASLGSAFTYVLNPTFGKQTAKFVVDAVKANAPSSEQIEIAKKASKVTGKAVGNGLYCPALTELGGQAFFRGRGFHISNAVAQVACMVFNYAAALDPIGSLGKLTGLTSE